MAKALPSDLTDQFDAGEIVERDMILFDFESGLYGFWTGAEQFEYQSVTYIPGSVLEVDTEKSQTGPESVPRSVSLSSIPDTALDPDVLASIEAETYHQRPVIFYTAYFDPADMSLITVITRYRGYLDKIVHQDGPDRYTVTAMLESRARDNRRHSVRLASDADQRKIDPDDQFFEHAASVRTEKVYFGKATPKPMRDKGQARRYGLIGDIV